MLTRAKLERLSNTVSNGNVGHAETLYFQDIVLSTVSRETSDQLVFKGGTALLKFYQLDRFSEDIDFTAHEKIQFDHLMDSMVRDLENYGATVAERSIEESETSVHARFGIQGPLYTGNRRSLCFLRVEVNKESTVSRLRTRRYTPQFPDLPAFDLAVLDEIEILAEKIRALLTRSQPRDLYDIHHLLQKSVQIELSLVQEKLDYYDIEYDPNRVLDAARDLESSWETLDPLVYSALPPFEEVIDHLEQELTRC
ncbi:MAG: nucleotidyl transferase AbiEii/AbiGii toxin family protein [Halobacteriaceae archaeon]